MCSARRRARAPPRPSGAGPRGPRPASRAGRARGRRASPGATWTPCSPSRLTPRAPGRSEITTGRPHAIASSWTMPNDSSVEGMTRKSAARRWRATSSWRWSPANTTRRHAGSRRLGLVALLQRAAADHQQREAGHARGRGDRQVGPLREVRGVELGAERGDRRVGGDAERRPQLGLGAGPERLDVDAVRDRPRTPPGGGAARRPAAAPRGRAPSRARSAARTAAAPRA